MVTLSFRKMHGLGNDFVVLDGRAAPISVAPALARVLADRRGGVGCDQIIILEPPESTGADLFMRILNADGSEAGACGNATRCVADLAMAETGADRVVIETIAGHLTARRAGSGLVTVDMGPARLDAPSIPLAWDGDTLHVPTGMAELADACCTNVGNPHATFFVEDADAVDLARLGPILEHHSLFPERANIGVASPLGPDRFRLRVWERGVGLTEACGSGACAAGVAAIRRGLAGRQVAIVMERGTLEIEWDSRGHALMTGPFAQSFEGVLDPDALVAGAA
jgi:diaminopimelate epimerase